MYFANPSTVAVRDAMQSGRYLGMIDTPKQGNHRPDGVIWCADNGCYGKGYPGDEKWMLWLLRNSVDADTCAFATAPDVVGDAEATLARSLPWLPQIREAGYPAALVAQDGIEELLVPWSEFDVLFIGGSTEWKLGEAARRVASEASERGKWVHFGRVNSLKRLRLVSGYADSADGTFIAFGPDVNLPKMLRWLDEVNRESER